eukprot:Gb_14966 [translate_table: standard]
MSAMHNYTITTFVRIPLGLHHLPFATILKSARNQHQIQNYMELFVGQLTTSSTLATILREKTSIVTLCKEGRLEDAVDALCFEGKGILTDADTYGPLLEGCINTKAFAEGKRIHAHMIRSGFSPDIYIGNRLMEMYAKCGSGVEARLVFDKMPVRNVFSWNTMISGYTKSGRIEDACHLFDKMPERNEVSWNTMISGFAREGYSEKALRLFIRMRRVGLKPTQFTCASIVNACGGLSALEQGKQVHAHIIRAGFESNIFVGNALVDMYAKCRCMVKANNVFDKMPEQDEVSWTAMIAGFGQSGYVEEAMNFFVQMQRAGIKADHLTFSSVLSACAKRGTLDYACQSIDSNVEIAGCTRNGNETETPNIDLQMPQAGIEPVQFPFGDNHGAFASVPPLEQGKQVHAHAIKSGSESNVFVGNALIDMYAKCRSIKDADTVFKKLPQCNVVSWNVMIAGYGQNGFGEHALNLLSQMQERGLKPDQVTFASVLSACAKCGLIENARNVFDKMSERSVISWNTMITGYVQTGHREKALKLFGQMQYADVKPDQVTLSSILVACASLGALEYGKQLHTLANRIGLESDLFVGSALVDMYAKCGSTENARQVFDRMPERDGVAWNSIIAGYGWQVHSEEVLTIFQHMQWVGVRPTEFTFGSIMSVCARLSVLEHGKQVHVHIIGTGFESNVIVATALIDMYSKCGSIEDAGRVFDNMPERNVVSWNGMIIGYAQNGCGKEALQLFEQMISFTEKPDHVTFIGVLSACSHAGLVDEGLHYFDSMSRNHSITPLADHYACVIDLLGRAGLLNEAENFINNMPFKPDAIIWGALLGACRIHGNMELGKHAAECLIELEPQNAAPYVMLSNIYAAVGRWDDAIKMRTMMKDRGVKKEPGCSWIEVKNRVHAFLVEDRSHPKTEDIYATLEALAGQTKEAGYEANVNVMLHDVQEA